MSCPDAFSVDERYDRVHASNRRSRYGAYLVKAATAFDIAGEPTTDAANFAAAALEIALPPVMAPPYVTSHRRILDTWSHHDDDGRVAIGISMATPHPVGIDSLLGWRCRGWSRDNTSGQLHVSDDNGRPAAYSQLTMRIPLNPRRLPQPRYRADGTPHVDTAKEAVQLAIVQLNGVLGELLAALTTRRAA